MNSMTSTWQLTGLHCASCQKIVTKRVQKINGVQQATVDLETGTLLIQGERAITATEVRQALEGTDYQVQ